MAPKDFDSISKPINYSFLPKEFDSTSEPVKYTLPKRFD